MSKLNVGPIVRAYRWRKRYAKVWFGLFIIAVLATVSLTDHSLFEILNLLLIDSIDRFLITPLADLRFDLSHLFRYLIFILQVTIILWGIMRFKISSLILAILVYLSVFILPLSLSSDLHHTGMDQDDLIRKVFGLPGLIACLVALLNEIRYRRVAESHLYEGELNQINPLRKKKRHLKYLPYIEKAEDYRQRGISLRAVGVVLYIVLACVLFAIGKPLLIGGTGAILVSIIFPIALWMKYMARKTEVRTVDEIAEIDDRPPILLLRSFKNDRLLTQLEPGTDYLGRGQPYSSLSDRFERLLRPIGPLSALPEPEVSFPFGGIATVPVDTDWKDTFYSRISASRLIIVFISDSDGLLWEIRELLARAEVLQYTAFVFINPINHRETVGFLNFLRSLENLPIAERLYDGILPSRDIPELKQSYASETIMIDKLLPRKYRSDEPLLIRFSKSGDPLVINGPLIWEAYRLAFKRYVLAS